MSSDSKDKDKPSPREEYSSLVSNFTAGVILPILLGSFTIPSLLIAAAANDQSQVANQLALLSLCMDLNETSPLCGELVAQIDSFLPVLINTTYDISPNSVALVSGAWGQAITTSVTYILYSGLGITLFLTLGMLATESWRIWRRRGRGASEKRPADQQNGRYHQKKPRRGSLRRQIYSPQSSGKGHYTDA